MGGIKMKRAKSKVIKTEIFHNFAEACRILSNSIISDADMVYEFNKLTENKKRQIEKEISCIDTNSKVDNHSIEWQLRIVDIHIVSGKYGVDPAVALLTGVIKSKEKLVIL